MTEEQDAQNIMMEMQQVQSQLQQITVQKEETESEIQGINKSLEELDEEADGTVYKSAGNILVEKEKGQLVDELEDRKETLETRTETLTKKEERLQKKMQETQQKFTQMQDWFESMSAQSVANEMKDLAGSDSVPSNVADTIRDAANQLESDDKDLSVRVNMASSLLDQVSNDPNVKQHTRTEIWNLASKVEGLD